MKVCFPTRKNEGLDSLVYNHFGSAPLFLLVDTETKEIEVVTNKHVFHRQAACSPVRPLVDLHIDALVVAAIGSGAIMKLNLEGIRVYRSAAPIIKENLDLLTTEGLREITLDHACGGGKSGCSYH